MTRETARPLDIHLIAIGGTGMAPLACLLKEAGHRVRGSDGPLYPPMSALLERHGIQPLAGYDAAHLEPRPDLVVVGNAVPRGNPEAQEAERLGLERLSMPEALARFFLDRRRPLVVAGTHGKTTTTSLAAWTWAFCGADPGYLIGGLPVDLPASFARGTGERFIVEGDEYNAAYFDRGPKFLHYRPDTLILTSVEYDHADLYASPAALLAAYRALVASLPSHGLFIACGDSPDVRRLGREAPCRVLYYGLEASNDLRPDGPVEHGEEGSRLRVDDGGSRELKLRSPGEHTVANALAVWAAARAGGLPPEGIAGAFACFRGVRRRMEELGTTGGVTVVDDFAHHPTAVRETLRALRRRYPRARLVALFEPRSLTAGRATFFDAYAGAFREADRVLFAPVFHGGRLAPEERLDLVALAASLARNGTEAQACGSVEDLFDRAVTGARPGDVLVTMSSGDFSALPQRLLAALGDTEGGQTGG